jgi:uncharacterized protein YgbK (DUF1537 family)
MALLPAAIIADDLTGAADAAAGFARPGNPVPVSLGDQAQLSEGRSAFAVTTESRSMLPQAAYESVAAAVRSASPAGLLYKKIDSNLRGNIAAELAAASEAAGRPIVLAPAFPARGRTVVHGVALVHGRPAADTEMGRDPQAPVLSSHIEDIIHSQRPELAVTFCSLETVWERGRTLTECLGREQVVVADAETDSDLDAIAEAALSLDPVPVLAGSGGLARTLAARLLGPAVRRQTAADSAPPSARRPALAVLASSSQRLAEQVQAAAQQDDLRPVAFPCTGLSWSEEEVPELSAAIARANSELQAGRDAIVYAVGALPEAPRPVDLVVEHLAHLAFVVLKQSRPAALVVGGGATAHSVLSTLGAHVLEVDDEPLPGVAAVEGHADGLPVVLKPGAAGNTDALGQLIRYARGRAAGREEPI